MFFNEGKQEKVKQVIKKTIKRLEPGKKREKNKTRITWLHQSRGKEKCYLYIKAIVLHMNKYTKLVLAILATAAVCYAFYQPYEIDPQEAAIEKALQERRLTSGC